MAVIYINMDCFSPLKRLHEASFKCEETLPECRDAICLVGQFETHTDPLRCSFRIKPMCNLWFCCHLVATKVPQSMIQASSVLVWLSSTRMYVINLPRYLSLSNCIWDSMVAPHCANTTYVVLLYVLGSIAFTLSDGYKQSRSAGLRQSLPGRNVGASAGFFFPLALVQGKIQKRQENV